jgi:hypothetical protein
LGLVLALGGILPGFVGFTWVRLNGTVARHTRAAPKGTVAALAVMLTGFALVGLSFLLSRAGPPHGR